MKFSALLQPPPAMVAKIQSWALDWISRYYFAHLKGSFNLPARNLLRKLEEPLEDLWDDGDLEQVAELEQTLTMLSMSEFGDALEPLRQFVNQAQAISPSLARGRKSWRRLRRELYPYGSPLDVLSDILRSVPVSGLSFEEAQLELLKHMQSEPRRLDAKIFDRGGVAGNFALDLTGWRYAKPGYAPKRTVSLALKLQSGRDAGRWFPDRWLMEIYVPPFSPNLNFAQILSDRFDVVEHECVHLAQTVLADMSGASVAGVPLNKPSGYDQNSLNKRQVFQGLVDQGVPSHLINLHSLDDLEFYAKLNDSVRKLRKKIAPQMSRRQFNNVVRRFIGSDAFLRELGAIPNQRKKFQKAVRILYTVGGADRIAFQVLGTKSKNEREDEHTRAQVKKAPKKKPPRQDKRKRRMVDADPDFKDVGGAEKDRDLSLNYKGRSASPVRVAWLYRISKDSRKPGTSWKTKDGYAAKNSKGETQSFVGDNAKDSARAFAMGQSGSGSSDDDKKKLNTPIKPLDNLKPLLNNVSDSLKKKTQTPEQEEKEKEKGESEEEGEGEEKGKGESEEEKAKREEEERLRQKADEEEYGVNPIEVGGFRVNNRPMSPEKLKERTLNSFEEYRKKSKAEVQQMLDQLAKAIDTTEPGTPRAEELDAVLTGIQMVGLSKNLDTVTSSGARLRPKMPPAFVQLFQTLDRQNRADELLMTPEEFYGREGRNLILDAMGSMGEESLITFGVNLNPSNQIYADALRDTKTPLAQYQRNLLLKSIQKDLLNYVTVIPQALEAYAEEAGLDPSDDALLEKFEALARQDDPQSQKMQFDFLGCLTSAQEGGGAIAECQKKRMDLELRQLQLAQEAAQEATGVVEVPKSNPAAVKLQRAVETGDLDQLDVKYERVERKVAQAHRLATFFQSFFNNRGDISEGSLYFD